jgi:hypothetical protein
LEPLRFNDEHDGKRLGGFAIETERLVQFLTDYYDMKYVQLFHTNLPDGILAHAASIEDMKTRRKKVMIIGIDGTINDLHSAILKYDRLYN